MANESRGLGRGLQALLSAQTRAAVAPSAGTGERTLPLSAIRTGPSQPRRTIQTAPLEELAASIKANGVIQPIVVRPISKSTADAPGFEIVAGERRWQAAKLAGLVEIPVVVRELNDQDAVAVALIENIQREELTPAEEARSLQRLTVEFALTHQQVATAVGRSRAAVSNLIRLLDLPPQIVALIDAKSLSMGHARALLGLEHDVDRIRLGSLVAERGLSVRDTEKLVRKALTEESVEAPKKSPELSVLSEVLTTDAVRVQLHQGSYGKGRLVVEFKDVATRDEILEAIRQVVQD